MIDPANDPVPEATRVSPEMDVVVSRSTDSWVVTTEVPPEVQLWFANP